jgi:hypothetical protein
VVQGAERQAVVQGVRAIERPPSNVRGIHSYARARELAVVATESALAVPRLQMS